MRAKTLAHTQSVFVAAFAVYVFSSQPAFAYMGPGSGLTALGTLAALIGIIFLGIIGFLWYPIKKLIKKFRKNENVPNGDVSSDGSVKKDQSTDA